MHLRRLIVAAIALPLFYLYIAKLSPFFFLILLIIVAAIAQTEFYSMYRTGKAVSLIGVLGGILTLSAPYLASQFPDMQSPRFSIHASVFVLSFMMTALTRLFIKKEPESSLRDISPALIGLFYIPNLLVAQWYLRLKGYEWILFLYGCVYASDSFAYYIGKGMGKRKLYKEVSPNKTVEGAAGSVAGGILSSLLLGRLLLNHVGSPELIIIGGIIGGVTIAGDLVESMFKRDAGIKDSGSIIPGHGGVLDKIDGALFAGPVLYWITLLL
ncbi:MAG: phosphatidate cytidylyltransferase [Nitrospirae bacterium]|nr:phosphatidate cytidylyltransferase [Nitrospirota bacterium]